MSSIRGISLLGAAVFACACGRAASGEGQSAQADAHPAPAPRFLGRFDFSDPAGPRFSWSTTTIEARFAGRGIAMRLRVAPAPAGHAEEPLVYTVRIDGAAPRTLSVHPGERRYVLADALDPSRPHVVSVTRESEAFAGVHQFLGFDPAPGGELLAPPPGWDQRPRIEIVGDSITCGYGVLGSGADCHFSFATERATAAYGALAASALDADVTTLCWSGRGVYRNFDEIDAPPMPALFETAVPQDLGTRRGGAQARFGPPPAAVVVSLGTNDVLADHDHDGKRDRFDERAFEDAYARFLVRIREIYPPSRILVTLSPMLSGDARAIAARSIERVVRQRRSEGEARIDVVAFEEQGTRVGCDYHPNAEMQGVLARQLAGALAPNTKPDTKAAKEPVR